MSDKTEYLVTEITVEASHKGWKPDSVLTPQVGKSGGTTFTMTVKPRPGSSGWTPKEADEVAIRVRKKLQGLLVVDARVRRVDEPDDGEETLRNYETAIKSILSTPS